MSDVTKDWAGGEPLRDSRDSTQPARDGEGLTLDSGDSTAPAATAPAESRTFETAIDGGGGNPEVRTAEQLADDDSLLRASLETIRVKAEELRGQARGWALVRSEQARQAIDERPVTAVAAAFGAGLLLGALLSR